MHSSDPESHSWKKARQPVPPGFNIATAICDVHPADHLAMVYQPADGPARRLAFGEISSDSRRLANALQALGVRKGDRVGVILPQRPETLMAHLAILRLGAIAVALTPRFGPDALRSRLLDAGAVAVITDLGQWPKVAEIRPDLSDLRHSVVADGRGVDGTHDFAGLLGRASDRFETVPTAANAPAVVVYTSGSTGNPKGVLHAHRSLPGRLSGIRLCHQFPKAGDLFWTPADWAWVGGLLDSLFSPLYFGVPVLAWDGARFDAEAAMNTMARFGVQNSFIPPTALKMMRNSLGDSHRTDVRLRSVHCGGEVLAPEVMEWAESYFGTPIQEIYGMTECGFVIGNAIDLFPIRPGSMGRAYPGHLVEIVDKDGNLLPPGEEGEVAIHRSDDGMFLGYWQNPAATAEKFRGEWFLSGDLAAKDPDGYFWFKSRHDDVIISAGYRIGPSEIEMSLSRHPAVQLAAVVASPDPLRGAIVKAFIKLRPDYTTSDALVAELQQHVKTQVANYAYPRAVEFLEEMPLTVTGKVNRSVLRKLEEERKGNNEEAVS